MSSVQPQPFVTCSQPPRSSHGVGAEPLHPRPGRPSRSRVAGVSSSLTLVCVVLVLLTMTGCLYPRLSSTRFSTSKGQAWFIQGVRVFDGEQFLPPQNVLIRGGKIQAVAPLMSLQPPPDAQVINGTGLTLLPGLVDMHVHLGSPGNAPWELYVYPAADLARAQTYAGVTRALVANNPNGEARLARRIEKGRLAAPQLYLAGPGITAPGGHPIPLLKALVPFKALHGILEKSVPGASTPEEVRAIVKKHAEQHKTPYFKIFFDAMPPSEPQLSRALLEVAAKEARAQGMLPIAHVGSCNDMVAAAEAGVALIMHTPYKDTLTADQLNRLKELGVPFVSTLRIYEGWTDATRAAFSPLTLEMTPPKMLTAFQQRPVDYQPEGLKDMEASFPKFAENARLNAWRLIEAGVPYFVGTDAGVPGLFQGAALHNEVDVLNTMGLPKAQILRRLTLDAVRFLEPSGEVGKIQAGQAADLLLVKGNLEEDIQALHQLHSVMVGGRWVERRPGGQASP